jgi:hypothetical protein
MADVQTSEVIFKICTSQRGTLKFCMLTDLHRKGNFHSNHFLWKKKQRGWRLKLKFIFCFTNTTHEPSHLEQRSFVLYKIVNIPTGFTRTISFFDETFIYGDCAKFWHYVRTNAESLSVEFCNFLQYRISVHCLSSCIRLPLLVSPSITFQPSGCFLLLLELLHVFP